MKEPPSNSQFPSPASKADPLDFEERSGENL